MAAHEVRRLGPDDLALAQETFALMASVFEEEAGHLSDGYVSALLADDDFCALAALVNGDVAGGLTAHTLRLTRIEARELFIYDIAVAEAQQRRGIGRALLSTLRALGVADGIDSVWVLADNEDTHATDFYRALGGAAAPVTAFSFGPPASI